MHKTHILAATLQCACCLQYKESLVLHTQDTLIPQTIHITPHSASVK